MSPLHVIVVVLFAMFCFSSSKESLICTISHIKCILFTIASYVHMLAHNRIQLMTLTLIRSFVTRTTE